VNVRVVVKAGAPAVFHAQKRSANYIADEPVLLDDPDEAKGASGDVDVNGDSSGGVSQHLI
jgi:hypothetical protein